MKKEEYYSLDEFAGGALKEKFNEGMSDILKNFKDLNKEPNKMRKLTIEVKMVSDESRDMLSVDIMSKTSLAPDKAVSTYMMIGKDNKGKLVAEEIKKELPGQGVMEDNVGKITFIGDAK